MRISQEWLREYVDFNLKRKELEEVFSSMGFPPEEVIEWGNDHIFDLEITPNRPDCLSHYGLAREISVFLDLPLKKITFSLEESQREAKFSISINAPDLCPKYVARIVEGVQVGSSPDWLQEKLEKMGLQSVNSVVDLSNYLLYALGHPTHVFDLDKLQGGIIVRKAREGENIVCLDGIERELTPQDLVIADERGPVAIAGVIGGEESGVTLSTKRVLIESAYFDPVAIRKTSKRLGITTDASYRFERGADPMVLEFAADFLASLIKEIAGGEVLKGRIMSGQYKEKRRIKTTFSFINSRIGEEIKREFVEGKLKSMGCEVKIQGEELEITPPSWRRDLEIPEDIIEEVIRIFGYENVKGSLPPLVYPQGLRTDSRDLLWEVRERLIGLGYYEAMTYIWTFKEADQYCEGRGEPIKILNPIIKEMPLLRRSIIPTLLEAVSLNLRMGKKGVKLFEVGRVYWWDGEKPFEEKRIAIVEAGEIKERSWEAPPQHASFYSLKGTVEALLKSFGVEPEFLPMDTKIFEEGFSLGWRGLRLGVVKKDLLSLFDIEVPVFAVEFPISIIPSEFKKKYEDLLNYPYVRRDISMIFPQEVSFYMIRQTLNSLSVPILKKFKLIDLYMGKAIGEGRKSITLSLEFRAENRTLKSEEVDEQVNNIVKILEEKLGGLLRK